MAPNINNILARIIKQQTTASGYGGDFLPLPIATRYIDYVRDANYCRSLFRVQPMTSKTLDFPKILTAGNVYYENTETATAIRSTFSTGSIRFEAKKLMAKAEVSSECIEDAAFDMEMIVREQCGRNMGQAEEEAMMVGDVSHLATATSPSNATTTNWYQKDHKLIFNGLFTVAAGNQVQPVYANGAVCSSTHLRELMYQLGKYGRVMSELVVFLNPWSANQMLDDSKVVTMDKAGTKATIFTGAFFLLYGKINTFNEVFAPNGQGCMTPRLNPIIADRRAVKIERERVAQQDMNRYVISERIDFKVEYDDAVALIEGLEEPSDES